MGQKSRFERRAGEVKTRRKIIDDYPEYYNDERGKAHLDWLTPKEYTAKFIASGYMESGVQITCETDSILCMSNVSHPTRLIPYR